MLIPVSWLREYVDIPADVDAQKIADIFTRIGFEEEGIEYFGADLEGPLVVGRVVEFVEEEQANGKTIRWCQVEVAPGEVTGIVCGARNFFVDDKVVVVRPGATLPGGFQIAARKTYGHVSDGMICSGRELQFSDDHGGIIRLVELGLDPEVGTDAIGLLGLIDAVVDISVLPDRGYALSMRGAARELAAATGWDWRDPANIDSPVAKSAKAVSGEIKDATSCTRLVLRTLENFQPDSVSPVWMQRRLTLAGMRPISLAVDITNYVMLELGQPLHAYDKQKLSGSIKVERATADVKFTTLDNVERSISTGEILITDNSGVIGLAGVMGGLSTEMDENSVGIVLEAARFTQGDIARGARRHKLSSEASRRFERGVDDELGLAASARASQLLQEHGGAREIGGIDIDLRQPRKPIVFSSNFANDYLGTDFSDAEVKAALIAVGCHIETDEFWNVFAPSWRSDIDSHVDLIEEVARILGYDRIPSVTPPTAAGLGFTPEQSYRRTVSRKLAAAGLVEVLSYPFTGDSDFDALLIAADDPRRLTVKLANPLNAEAPSMRTSLLGPLLGTAKRNAGRGFTNIAIFEQGKVVLADSEEVSVAPQPSTLARPSTEILAELDAAVPAQPIYLAAVMTGRIEQGQPALSDAASEWDWQNTISLVGDLLKEANLEWQTTQIQMAPWHPGRCAGIVVAGMVVGFAGELHPKVCANFGLPPRTCAFEIDLDAVAGAGLQPIFAQPIRTMPKAKEDFAFVVDADLPAIAVAKSIQAVAVELIESVEVFDVYQGEKVPAGKKSVAVAVSLRAIDRTLSDSEIAEIRLGIIRNVEKSLNAKLR
jgi:phenylalanyl-tRNA synthetase beta chain